MSTTPHILFVCVENSCRSQMAEAFVRSLAGEHTAAWSAGSRPAEHIHPTAVQLMKERGIDLAGHRPRGLDDLPQVTWDRVVTMGCGDACPSLPTRGRLDWDLPDPKGMDDEGFRAVRDEIGRRVERLLEEMQVRQR